MPSNCSVFLLEKINSFRPKQIYITSHINADPDGFSSAIALASILNRYVPSSKVSLVFESLNNISKKIAQLYDVKVLSYPLETPDIWIILDTHNLKIIGAYSSEIQEHSHTIFLDHHKIDLKLKSQPAYQFCKEESSTGELLYNLLIQEIDEITAFESTHLLSSIIYDTRRFLHISPNTFKLAQILLEAGGDYYQILEIMNNRPDKSERIACIKAAQRANLIKIQGWIILTSQVKAFEASAARKMIGLGADIAIVMADRKNDVRISGRSTTNFYNHTNIHLGQLFSEIEPTISGTSGGHPTAAGANGKQNGRNAITQLIDALKKSISIPKLSSTEVE